MSLARQEYSPHCLTVELSAGPLAGFASQSDLPENVCFAPLLWKLVEFSNIAAVPETLGMWRPPAKPNDGDTEGQTSGVVVE
jgi:hypothetical protein